MREEMNDDQSFWKRDSPSHCMSQTPTVNGQFKDGPWLIPGVLVSHLDHFCSIILEDGVPQLLISQSFSGQDERGEENQQGEAIPSEQEIFYSCVHQPCPSFLTVSTLYPSGLQLGIQHVLCPLRVTDSLPCSCCFLQYLALIPLTASLFQFKPSLTQNSQGLINVFMLGILIMKKCGLLTRREVNMVAYSRLQKRFFLMSQKLKKATKN